MRSFPECPLQPNVFRKRTGRSRPPSCQSATRPMSAVEYKFDVARKADLYGDHASDPLQSDRYRCRAKRGRWRSPSERNCRCILKEAGKRWSLETDNQLISGTSILCSSSILARAHSSRRKRTALQKLPSPPACRFSPLANTCCRLRRRSCQLPPGTPRWNSM
jgi:hypothetical protein